MIVSSMGLAEHFYLYLSLPILPTIFPGGSALASTRMSPFGILLELRMKGGGGDDWSYKTYKALVKLTPSTNQQYTLPFTGQMPFMLPKQQCESSKENLKN